MKKLFTILSLSILFAACNSQEDKAKLLVKDFLRTELDDFNRYEAVSWGKLEKVENVLEQDKQYIEQKELVEKCLTNVTEATDPDIKEGAQNRYNQEKTKLDKYVTNYKLHIEGPYYRIEHTYRTPNKVGALELETDYFTIDTAFTKADYEAGLAL